MVFHQVATAKLSEMAEPMLVPASPAAAISASSSPTKPSARICELRIQLP